MAHENVGFHSLVSQEDPDKWSELTGVSFDAVVYDEEDSYRSTEQSQTCTFVLNGVTYTAVEDPSDGYRSSMRILYVGGECSNMFPPSLVRVTYRDVDPEYDNIKEDLLVLVDAFTGKDVLLVGTHNTYDYYPSFVANFQPENMVYNVTKR